MKGITLIEVLMAMTLTLGILTIAVGAVGQGGKVTKEVGSRQDRLESIFHAVDSIKSDLTKCGMRLQQAFSTRDQLPLETTENGFSATWGEGVEMISSQASRGDLFLFVPDSHLFKTGKRILVFSGVAGIYEEHQIKNKSKTGIHLQKQLQSDFPADSEVIVLKTVEYRFFPQQSQLKRKVDRGTFQPLLEEASDFYVHYFPESNSILYRIEMNKREQIRGYLFLMNMAVGNE